MSTPAVLPVMISAYELWAIFIPAIGWKRGKCILGFTFIIPGFLHGVSATFEMGSSVDLGKEQQMGRNQVALNEDVIADNGAFPPCYAKFTRATFGSSEATCLAVGVSTGNEAAHGALE